MGKQSAGILLYRVSDNLLEVLLVHPGGPFWAKKDLGAWSIPKGEFTDEEPLAAALREFEEEIGIPLTGTFMTLTPVMQKGGKKVYAFAQEQDLNVGNFVSNTFRMEWPPQSGKWQEFPEVDRAEWCNLETARTKIIEGQLPLLNELAERVG